MPEPAACATAAFRGPMVPRPCRILRATQETRDTFTWELEAQDALDKPFRPGQFNMLYLFGVGEVPISISGDPKHQEKIVHTIRAVGVVTGAMAKLKKESVVGMRGPYGTCWPMEEAAEQDVVLVAGGIGLAPLRPALYEIAAQRKRFGRVTLLYGSRTPEDILFRRELDRWINRAKMDVHVTVDRAGRTWPGNVGVVTHLFARASFEAARTVAMLCGPEIMMRFAAAELLKRGVPAEKIMVSLERNMKCAVGFCGHCQFGPEFICKDGPVFPFARVKRLLELREI